MTMRFLLPLALCLNLPFSLLAQDPPIKFGKIPKEDLEMKVYPPDTSAAAVVLCDYGTVAFQFKDNDAMNVLSRHKRIKFLRRSGFEHGDIEIPFYTSLMRVKNLKAQVFAPDGTETEVPKKDIFEEKINDRWSRYRFAFPNLQEGSVVEYKYDLESQYIFELPEWYFQGEIPVRWSELRLTIPNWFQYVSLRNGRLPDIVENDFELAPVVNIGGGSGGGRMTVESSKIRLAMKEAPALREEAYITTMDDYFARVRFQLKSVQYPETPARPIMGDWVEVATKLLEDENFGGQFSKKGKFKKTWAAAQAQIAGATTPEEKIRAIYHFVQTSFEREDGSTIYTRQNLDDLFEKKRAFASEMNLLLIGLLREAGFQAHPVLISTRDHGQPIAEYPILDQFNHVLAQNTTGKISCSMPATLFARQDLLR